MNSDEYVQSLLVELKASGIPMQEVAWKTAYACVGWPYVFGDRGQFCTPANRRAAYNRTGKEPIKTKCKNFNGTGSCSGCKWFPGGKRVREYDCRGFTYWVLKVVYGWELMGAGATSQWDNASNWKEKGTIDTMPQNTLVCLFVRSGSKMEHTGFGFNNETIECSNGVQYFAQRKSKWTHWGLPVCVEGDIPPTPIPEGYAVVTGKRVALRKDPSLQATIIMRIDTGETVKLEASPAKQWDYVSYNKKTGWMMREFLREEGDHAVVTGKRVALRKDPSLRATIIMRINTGETVRLEQEPTSEWDYVSYRNNVGYMMKQYLKEG